MSRLAWFPLYVDDFLGGTSAMLVGELGAYLAAMLAQWQVGELQAIPDDPARLARICGGEPFPEIVREKFERIVINGKPYLRNKRLASIWEQQKAVHDAQIKAGKQRANQAAKLPAKLPKNPEPITQNSEDQSGERNGASAEQDSAAPEGLSMHPAVRLYFERFRLIPAIVAQERMERLISDDIEGWIETLNFWQGNDHRPESCWRMMDRYEEQAKERRRTNGKAKQSIYDPAEQTKLKENGARLYPDGFYRPY